MPSQETEVDASFRDGMASDARLLRAYEAGTIRDHMYGNPITQLLIRFLAQESQDARGDLLDVDPQDTKRIVELQIKGQLIGALHEAITQALEQGDAEAANYDAEEERSVDPPD